MYQRDIHQHQEGIFSTKYQADETHTAGRKCPEASDLSAVTADVCIPCSITTTMVQYSVHFVKNTGFFIVSKT